MLPYATACGFTALVFFGLDFIWLSAMGGTFYKDRMGEMMLAQPNLAVAGVFYLLYIGGAVFLAVVPALNQSNWAHALIAGAVLGLVAYGTYDFTNLATLKNWSVSMSLVDLAWCTALTALSATAGYFGTKWLFP